MILLVLSVILAILLFLAVLDYVVRSTRINDEINFYRSHVMITGGTSGIGLALAKKCAELGSNVTIVARNKIRLATSKGEIENCRKHDDQQIACVSADICGDFQKLEASLSEACVQLGPVDILVNCAGYAICGSFIETPPEGFKSMVDTNYLGSVYVTKCILPHMIKRQHGHVVVVSSMGGLMGVHGYSAYTPSKYALRGFAEVLYSEVKPHGIGVSIVFPPDTDTPGYENENKTKPEVTRIISEAGGLFSSEEVARKIVEGIQKRKFLVSCGLDGAFLATLTCGTARSSSLIELITQVSTMGLLRLVISFYTLYFDRIIWKFSKSSADERKEKSS